MKETIKHREIFEYYYSVHGTQGLRDVAQKYHVSLTSLGNWSKAFNWQERIEQRDIENGKRLEQKTNEAVIDSKANYRKEIKVSLSVLKASLNDLIEKMKKNDNKAVIEINTLDQLNIFTNMYEKMVKLDMLLMGESTENANMTLTEIIKQANNGNR